MTPQEERNKRFDEEFPAIYREFPSGKDFIEVVSAKYPMEDIKTFLTSEVHLAIEQVERWVRDNKISDGLYATINADDLLAFLKELKK